MRLSSNCVLSLLLLLPIVAWADSTQEEIYRAEKVFDEEGNMVDERVVGAPWVEDGRGEKTYFFDETVGPDVTVYSVVQNAGDNPEGGFTYSTVVRKADIEWLSLEERIKQLEEGGAPEEYIERVIRGNDPNRVDPDPPKVDPDLLRQIDEMRGDEKVHISV